MSKIEWTDITINPWVGCTKLSPGCKNCYAERMAKRLKAMGLPQYQDVVDENGWTGEVRPAPWPPKFPGEAATPKMILLGSMTDIFHEQVPFKAILGLFSYMLASGGGNTFQILTKRIHRAREFFDNHFKLKRNPKFWIMSSICNQDEADRNISELLKIDAFVRGVSVEPMLGPVDLTRLSDTVEDCEWSINGLTGEAWATNSDSQDGYLKDEPKLDWVIAGAETGPGARPMEYSWPRNLCHQCVEADVPFFFKKDSEGSHELFGQLWEQYPERREP